MGNKTRKELISKWYNLNEFTLPDDEISQRIEKAIDTVDILLGSDKSFIIANPIFVLSTLQDLDAMKKTFKGSEYGYLYESLILNSLGRIGENYQNEDSNIDFKVLSLLSFRMLRNKSRSFSKDQMKKAVDDIGNQYCLKISIDSLISRMERARIIYNDPSYGDLYRFEYPYIFYYFCGRYIAYNHKDDDVKEEIAYMSSHLYNETYGNIIIFVCHFANNEDIVDEILLNAYVALEKYGLFDFSKDNPVIEDIKDMAAALIPQSIASSDKEVEENKEKRLERLDQSGIKDGNIIEKEDAIDDELYKKEEDMASIVSALKIIDRLSES